MSWRFLQQGRREGGFNMAFDEALLISARSIGCPVLRFYGWTEPAASFGYFQAYKEVALWTPLRPLVRRPTGGGLVPHDRDWTYTLVFPPEHWWYQLRAEESYRKLHEWVAASFATLKLETRLAPCCAKEAPGRCFAGPEKFDLLFENRKIAGAAQRRNKYGLLIQGSIQDQPAGARREEWENAMLLSGAELFQVTWEKFAASPEFLSRVEELVNEKYAVDDYHQKR